jgi:hypothetical protein
MALGMQELLRSNNLVYLSFAEAALSEAGIDCFVADSHTSNLEGSVPAIERRLMVASEDLTMARTVLAQAEAHAEAQAPFDDAGDQGKD